VAERLYRAYLRLVQQPTPESIEARNELGEKLLQLCGRCEEAVSEHQQALEAARSVEDRQGELEALRLQGLAYRSTSRAKQAQQRFEEALALHREAGNRVDESRLIAELASLCREQGQMDEARSLFEQALEPQRATGDRKGEGTTLELLEQLEERSYLGLVLSRCGHAELAGGHSGRALLEQLEALSHEQRVEPGGSLAVEAGGLRRAVEAFEAGEHDRLFRGELIEDIPEGLRRWLHESGQMRPPIPLPRG
jgi:tetratricopeptide (TPR) repeat protein